MASALTYHRLNFLDNLEWLDAPAYNAHFPTHFHDRICITLCRQGVECTQWREQELLSPPGHFSITPAGEVHANPNINDGSYSFLTYYISPDVIATLAGGTEFSFRQQVVYDPGLYRQFLQFPEAVAREATSQRGRDLLNQLVDKYVQTGSQRTDHLPAERFDRRAVDAYIDEKLAGKISLEELALLVGMDRFTFLRAFKRSSGITPGQYLSIKRVERGKQLLRHGYRLVDAALSVGFYDQSHFHRHFKYLVGTTPRAYQRACNIIQDIQ